MGEWIGDEPQRWGPDSPAARALNPVSFEPEPDEDVLRGICFCPAPYHAPFCRIGNLIARMERPTNLFQIKIC